MQPICSFYLVFCHLIILLLSFLLQNTFVHYRKMDNNASISSFDTEYDLDLSDSSETIETIVVNQNQRISDLQFTVGIEKFGKILLSKSKTPTVKQKKHDAMEALIQYYYANHCAMFTEAQISKRVQNLKQKVKQKTDANKTGNKRINLSKCDEKWFDLMRAQENPTISQVTSKFFIFVCFVKS